MRHSLTFAVCILIAALHIPEPALAETDAPREFGPWVFGLQAGAVHQIETDLEDAEADFSVNRVFVQPSISYAWDRRNTVSLSLGFGDSSYDFSSSTGVDPWDNIRDYRISLPIRFSPTGTTDVILIPSIRSDVEKGADLSDGQTEGILAGMSWTLSDTLTIGPGFGWFSEPAGGSVAFPIILVDWAITDRWSLTTGRGLAATQGPGLDLNYRLNDQWTLGFSGRFERLQFALDDETIAGPRFGEERSGQFLMTAQYSPWPMTSVSAFAGLKLGGELSIEDANERTLFRSDYDNTLAIGLVFRSRF